MFPDLSCLGYHWPQVVLGAAQTWQDLFPTEASFLSPERKGFLCSLRFLSFVTLPLQAFLSAVLGFCT